MSVLIKGMEMPKDCSECNFMYTTYMLNRHVCLAGDMFEIKVNSGIDANCPLVEIPEPHGRLIDADRATAESIKRTGKRLLAIDTAPTIIEAEGSEDK